MTITSHDMISENYLRLNIESSNSPCGSIDFISEKVNFNIIGSSFFKGMVAIKDIELEYKDGKLIFIFKNKKNLEFNCNSKEYEKAKTHFKVYGYGKAH
ncbi:hypothetical protein ABIE26_005174 [Pedobacter africanus]|uniref:Uncharacterized protein n=1 Tax=Pedobacter africanus TaxID=151894 RepID=A0ACC6L4R1_9SPHI|nr:hypothetical protein [Pedobacter africanus]MDR6786640.1 hypothetical protein [Pedobacter africanus]